MTVLGNTLCQGLTSWLLWCILMNEMPAIKLNGDIAVGRPRIELPDDMLSEMLADGMTKKDMSTATGISIPTLKKEIARLEAESGELMNYKELEHLQVTRIKRGILTRLEEKLEAGELPPDVQVTLLNTLNRSDEKRKELGKVDGLMGHLMAMEKERVEKEKLQEANKLLDKVKEQNEVIDITPEKSDKRMPRLGIND